MRGCAMSGAGNHRALGAGLRPRPWTDRKVSLRFRRWASVARWARVSDPALGPTARSPSALGSLSWPPTASLDDLARGHSAPGNLDVGAHDGPALRAVSATALGQTVKSPSVFRAGRASRGQTE